LAAAAVRRGTVALLMLVFVKERDLGISQSLRSASDRPDPTGMSVSETRKTNIVQKSSQNTAEPAATITAAAAGGHRK